AKDGGEARFGGLFVGRGGIQGLLGPGELAVHGVVGRGPMLHQEGARQHGQAQQQRGRSPHRTTLRSTMGTLVVGIDRAVWSLEELGINALLTSGVDDTAYSARKLAEAAGRAIRVAHVPKTIDNDLPLPRGVSTFGFQTARHVGVELVNNLMTDAITTKRWFFVVAMGRSAGHLAVRIGKAAGATLTVIAEEFPADRPIRLDHLVDLIDAAMLKRLAHGRPFGVVVLSEGIALRMEEDELATAMPDVERDEHGHIRLGELDLDGVLAGLVKRRFRERGQEVTITPKNIGYELRCVG